MPRYRYIESQNHKRLDPESRLADVNLYNAKNLGARNTYYLRVTIPEDVPLIKRYSGSLYTRAEGCKLLIKDVDPVAVVRINNRATHIKGLWPHPMGEWPDIMKQKGYRYSIHVGFTKAMVDTGKKSS